MESTCLLVARILTCDWSDGGKASCFSTLVVARARAHGGGRTKLTATFGFGGNNKTSTLNHRIEYSLRLRERRRSPQFIDETQMDR